jgi:nucleotide-binding universal stress UspA family protein
VNSSVKQLLVHADAGSSTALRMDIALKLAQAHGASVRALYAATPSEVAAFDIGAGAVTDAFSRAQGVDADRSSRARAMFDSSVAKAGAAASWDVLTQRQLADAFARQAWFADLLVLGQRDPSSPGGDQVPADFVEAVITASGRPGLVIPYAGAPASVGTNVAIAWKESREAAHAVAASMPFLRRAQSVHILTWSTQPYAPPTSGALDLNSYLLSHGVKAQWHWEGPETQPIGEMLLSRTYELQADMLVMGCYSHSRAREWLLGGASRTLLESMTLPVLMVH